MIALHTQLHLHIASFPSFSAAVCLINKERCLCVEMKNLNVDTGDVFSSLLDLAANNDVDGFKQSAECDPSTIDEVGLWYCRQKGSKQMIFEHRTPLMVASMYGSVDIVKLILSLSLVDVNRACGLDKSTALHCAASGGSSNAVDVVKMLLKSGADIHALDINGHRPVDVINTPPKLQDLRLSLEELLTMNGSSFGARMFRESTTILNSNTPPLSSSPGIDSPSSSTSESPPSPINSKFDDQPPICSSSEKKEYPIDPSIPDIKNSIYATDEFRMYQFKVRPCSRAYSHDWTECPFVHPGENARRRDPRKYHYSCVPCPDFRKGACKRGDMCQYAHGVFECWLHPAQYRTRLCKDGTSCNRRVCFFAHTPEELRPLYVSMGSGLQSPRSANSGMEMSAAMNFMPGSPSSVMSPSAFTPPMSPSANGISHSSMAWPQQQDVPSLRLPGSNLQSSRLRSSLNARDLISAEDFRMLSEFDAIQQQQQQNRLLSELSFLSINSNSLNGSGRSLRTLNPSNLDDLFSSESSPRFAGQQPLSSTVYSPTHKSAVFNQFQQQQQSMLSPINTSNFSHKNIDHPFLQASSSSSCRMSPRGVDPVSPMSARSSTVLGPREMQLHQLRNLNARDLGPNVSAIVGSPVHSRSAWGGYSNHNNKPEWPAECNEPDGRMRRSSSFELGSNGEEPDLSWVQSLVKESPNEVKEKAVNPPFAGEESNLNPESNDPVRCRFD
ncbi:hypothetical protein V2J09_015962 [Rumex salicifolius]